MLSPTDRKSVRLLILDDHVLFRRGIARLLEAEPDMELAGDCSSAAEALELMRAAPVDLLLLDYDLGGERGSDLLIQMNEEGIKARVLVVTAGVSGRQAIDLIQLGVAGIFPKTESPEALVEAIHKVQAGEVWLRQEHLQLLLQGMNEPQSESSFNSRERAIMRAVVEGLANKEIADALEISESSVKAALQQVFTKTGVRTRSQLVRVALDRYRDLVV